MKDGGCYLDSVKLWGKGIVLQIANATQDFWLQRQGVKVQLQS